MMTEIEALQKQLTDAKEAVSRKQMLEKLSKNREFKALVLEYFLEEECARYVHASVLPALPADKRANALAIAQSAGFLKQFFSTVEQQGYQAEEQIPAIEAALVELRSVEFASTTVGSEEA